MRLSTPETPKFRKTINELMERHEKFISLGLGEPEIETPMHIKEAAYKALLDGYTKYSNAAGLEDLRTAISNKFINENGIESGPGHVLITPGGKNALFIACMGLVEDGCEVINLTPCYVSNIPILHLSSRNIKITNIPLRSTDYRIDRELLENSITDKTRLLIINFPNNPSGVILCREDADYLSDLLCGKNIYIISDEVYEKFVYEGEHISPGSYAKIKDKVITINSFSKSHFMTGWRIGYLNANPDIVKELLKINLHINTNTPAFTQRAALAALNTSNDCLKEYLKELNIRRNIFHNIIKEINPEIKLPAGGLFVFLNISSTKLKSDEFASKLLEKEKVAVLAGINFGNNYDDFCRISLACNTTQFEEGISRIKRFLENYE